MRIQMLSRRAMRSPAAAAGCASGEKSRKHLQDEFDPVSHIELRARLPDVDADGVDGDSDFRRYPLVALASEEAPENLPLTRRQAQPLDEFGPLGAREDRLI